MMEDDSVSSVTTPTTTEMASTPQSPGNDVVDLKIASHTGSPTSGAANVEIGEYTIVFDNVEIGDNSIIESHCSIGNPSESASKTPLIIGPDSHYRRSCGGSLEHPVILRSWSLDPPVASSVEQLDLRCSA